MYIFILQAKAMMMKKRFFYNVEIFYLCQLAELRELHSIQKCMHIFLAKKKKLKPTLAFQGSLSLCCYFFLRFCYNET